MANYEIIDGNYVYYVPFPADMPNEHEAVLPCLDGYTIYIDITLDAQSRRVEYNHALEHIRSGHIDNREDRDVQVLESAAHGQCIEPEVKTISESNGNYEKLRRIYAERRKKSHRRLLAYEKKREKRDRFLIAIGIDPNQWVIDHREYEEL